MNLTRYQLLNTDDFAIPVLRIASYYNSILPSTIRDWNALSPTIRNSATLNTFKNRIYNTQGESISLLKYISNGQTTRDGQIYHTRLRLQCSAFNQHLQSKNIIKCPLCTCGAVEDSAHYLLACPNYRTNRQRYLFMLPHAPTLPLLLNGNPALPDEVNDQIFS